MQNSDYLFKLLIHGEAHVILTDDPILVGVQGFEGLPHPVIPLLILLHLGDTSKHIKQPVVRYVWMRMPVNGPDCVLWCVCTTLTVLILCTARVFTAVSTWSMLIIEPYTLNPKAP